MYTYKDKKFQIVVRNITKIPKKSKGISFSSYDTDLQTVIDFKIIDRDSISGRYKDYKSNDYRSCLFCLNFSKKYTDDFKIYFKTPYEYSQYSNPNISNNSFSVSDSVFVLKEITLENQKFTNVVKYVNVEYESGKIKSKTNFMINKTDGIIQFTENDTIWTLKK